MINRKKVWASAAGVVLAGGIVLAPAPAFADGSHNSNQGRDSNKGRDSNHGRDEGNGRGHDDGHGRGCSASTSDCHEVPDHGKKYEHSDDRRGDGRHGDDRGSVKVVYKGKGDEHSGFRGVKFVNWKGFGSDNGWGWNKSGHGFWA